MDGGAYESLFGKGITDAWRPEVYRGDRSRNRAYPSDTTDAEWTVLEPLVPAVKPGGRPARHARRDIVDAIY